MNTTSININEDDFDIFYIRHKLYNERIQNEIKELKQDEERYKYLNNLISTSSNINNDDINNTFDKVMKLQCKKPWRSLQENYKITKIQEYCEEKGLDDEKKNKLINAVKTKKLKTADVNYDIENIKIIDIKFKF